MPVPLNTESSYLSLARFIDIYSINHHIAKSKRLIIEDLESDQTFQDLVLSVFHATTHTFSGTPTVKIIENQLGKAFVKQFIQFSTPALQPPPTAVPSS